MKRFSSFLISFLFFLVFPFSVANVPEDKNIRWISKSEPIEHLFTHALISDTSLAFQKGNAYGKYLDEDCLTASEFEKIIALLYESGYALVDFKATYTVKNGVAERISFPFPVDKKPLILSFDDIVYARKNLHKGLSDKLVVQNGELYANTDNVLHKNEFAPILEDFIFSHPDFSYHNARGIIFLTGFDGILGYRTERTNKSRAKEIENARPVVDFLKEKGWLFGSHSYAHKHYKNLSKTDMEQDLEKWKNEVETLVGKTDLYAFPYGEWELGTQCDDERLCALEKYGFQVFFGVGNAPFYTKLPYRSTKKILFQDRTDMDGIALRSGKLDRLFSAEAVYDFSRPIPLL